MEFVLFPSTRQPCAVVTGDQQQPVEGMQYECCSQSTSVFESENNADMDMIQGIVK